MVVVLFLPEVVPWMPARAGCCAATTEARVEGPGVSGVPVAARSSSRKLCRGTFGGRRKAVRDRLALQGGTEDFP